jgi:thiol-disulfide isomerase/thioredoxin
MHKFILSALLLGSIFLNIARADTADLTKPLDLKFTAIDGRPVDLAKMRGKVVLIDFWATWCPPCRHIAPDVVGLYQKYHSKGLEVIGVSVDSDKDGLLDAVKKEGLVWPQYCDYKGADNEVAAKYGIEQFPTLFLVNKKGVVVNGNLVDLWATDGAFEETTSPATLKRIDDAIEKELNAP